MNPNIRGFFDLQRLHAAGGENPLILVNGLAEQSESWFANRRELARRFDVKIPEILVYDGDSLHDHIDRGGEITVAYLADRLLTYLNEFVQRPPYYLVGSSLGGQIIATLAARRPELVAKLVFICPSGFNGGENLPIMEGVRRSRYDTLVKSVFHSSQFADEKLVRAIERKFVNRRWKKGIVRTVRGTVGHTVRPLLDSIPHQCLLIWGAEDKIISDVRGSIRAADGILKATQVVIPNCGHAPQIERAALVNALVQRFLRDRLRSIPQSLDPARFLAPKRRGRRPLAFFK